MLVVSSTSASTPGVCSKSWGLLHGYSHLSKERKLQSPQKHRPKHTAAPSVELEEVKGRQLLPRLPYWPGAPSA